MQSVQGREDSKPKILGVGDWELNLLIVESIIFSGLVMAGVWVLIDKVWHLARPVSMAIGFFAAEWASYPAISALSRSKNHRLHLRSQLLTTTLSAILGGILFWLVSTYWR